MKYCVVKNTTKVIDGSDNDTEIMLQNAQNTGFLESEVEILTEVEYKARVELEPKPIAEPTLEEKFAEQELVISDLINLLADKGVIY